VGKKGGRNKMKRLSAPAGWDISRKKPRFILKPVAGPHSVVSSYPLGVVVRDLEHMASTGRELKRVVNEGKVLVDGRVRKSARFPVGLFDVVSIPSEELDLRLVPSPKGLRPEKVVGGEAGSKLCRVVSKTKVKGGHIQYGLHDGRSLLDDSVGAAPGDAVLLELPSQKVVDTVKLAKGSVGLVLSGDRAGQLGKIVSVKAGTISRERMVKIALKGGDAELPSRIVFPVGVEKPVITVEASAR
jgi:small subunit ribosomal protein S4e